MTLSSPAARTRLGVSAALIGWLFCVEFTSGILQGYYVPLVSDIVKHLGIHDADYNWFDAAQLLLSALVVPVLAKLGDMFGHKRMLLIATALTALATWALAFSGDFTTYLIAFALQGFYVVWLPLEVALIFDRGRRSDTAVSQTRRAAGFLVVALESGAIVAPCCPASCSAPSARFLRRSRSPRSAPPSCSSRSCSGSPNPSRCLAASSTAAASWCSRSPCC